MPILEAMACGTPVVAARGSSLDEIGGTAAIRFDHDNPQELATAINVLLEDEGRRAEAIAVGSAWSTRFTWEQAGRKTRIVLEENLLD
jgi:glycosyltransferase involved in cell wall biosynthesis